VTSPAWQAALDQLEADLAETEAALQRDANEPRRTVPELRSQFPADPLPPDLAPRAEDLLARTRRLEAIATGEIDGIRRALGSLAGSRPTPPASTGHTGHLVDFGA
jgi:hypothetical protein